MTALRRAIFRYSAIGALLVQCATVMFATLGCYLVIASAFITASVERTFGAAAWAGIMLLLRDLTRYVVCETRYLVDCRPRTWSSGSAWGSWSTITDRFPTICSSW